MLLLPRRFRLGTSLIMREERSPILLIICIFVMAGVCVGLFMFRKHREAQRQEQKQPQQVAIQSQKQLEQKPQKVITPTPLDERVQWVHLKKEPQPLPKQNSAREVVHCVCG